jgi:two-component system sensor histidine kinase and response regulator WspE
MTPTSSEDFSNFSMMDLFRLEAENHTGLLVAGLLALERAPQDGQLLEGLMRSAHSLKGAAQLVGLGAAVQVAHAMEDRFVAAQTGAVIISPERIDLLLQGVEFLKQLAQSAAEDSSPDAALQEQVRQFVASLKAPETTSQAPAASLLPVVQAVAPEAVEEQLPLSKHAVQQPEIKQEPKKSSRIDTVASSSATESVVRVSAENVDQLMRLAGESIVATRWFESSSKELAGLKRLHASLSTSLRSLNNSLASIGISETLLGQLAEIRDKDALIRQSLADNLADLDMFDRHLNRLSQDLYHCVLDCRMRPFADGIVGFPLMVRNVSRSLGKDVDFQISGEATLVDRNILEKIEAPLGHLLRNAMDHGLEMPEERLQAGKPAQGVLRLESRHFAGQLLIVVEDDGRGVDFDNLRTVLVQRELVTSEMAENLSEKELLEFLFLPGFSLRNEVTEISGRGVGLDAVQVLAREVSGCVSISSQPHQGTRFEIQLPLTLSVVRTLLVMCAGNSFAFPLARTIRVLKLPKAEVESVEGRQHFLFGERHLGLVMASQVLGLDEASLPDGDLSVVVLGNEQHQYGVVVDSFLEERELVVRPLDPRLGRVQDIAAAALMPDQSPVLIIDVEDFIHSIRRLISGEGLAQIAPRDSDDNHKHSKRILVVDDSLTVRELERKLMLSRGYEVEVAVDGMEAWSAVRANHYDLVVTDVDMPRLDGIELTTLIKTDARLQNLPVMIVSYKDREEDRRRGLDAGADYYLAKASFHDETLLTAVEDLIGEAHS